MGSQEKRLTIDEEIYIGEREKSEMRWDGEYV
jgi:hypothetical protein